MSERTKRLADMKPGDHMWWEGEICKVVSVERNCNSHTSYAVQLEGWSEPVALKEGVNWAVPSDEEVDDHYRSREEIRQTWLKTRPLAEAKCMAAARRVALALGHDPDLAEKQMREKLDAERREFEEEYG